MLHDLQHELIEALTNDGYTTNLLTPAHHLIIHDNNIQTTLRMMLRETFPLTIKLVGDEYFDYLAQKYIDNYPNATYELYRYGAYFHHFSQHQDALANWPYLHEFILFEWLCHQVWHAPEYPSFDTKKLKSVPTADYGQLRFILHPALELLSSQYPIFSIMELCHGQHQNDIDVSTGGVELMITKQQDGIKLIPLSAAEYHFLNAIKHNETLNTAYDTALKYDKQFALNEKLPLWISTHTIVDLA